MVPNFIACLLFNIVGIGIKVGITVVNIFGVGITVIDIFGVGIKVGIVET